jgi:hypothetical protein
MKTADSKHLTIIRSRSSCSRGLAENAWCCRSRASPLRRLRRIQESDCRIRGGDRDGLGRMHEMRDLAASSVFPGLQSSLRRKFERDIMGGSNASPYREPTSRHLTTVGFSTARTKRQSAECLTVKNADSVESTPKSARQPILAGHGSTAPVRTEELGSAKGYSTRPSAAALSQRKI